MQGIIDRLMELPGADGASLSTIDGDVAYFRVAAGADMELLHKRLPIEDTLGVECLRRGAVTVLRANEATGGRALPDARRRRDRARPDRLRRNDPGDPRPAQQRPGGVRPRLRRDDQPACGERCRRTPQRRDRRGPGAQRAPLPRAARAVGGRDPGQRRGRDGARRERRRGGAVLVLDRRAASPARARPLLAPRPGRRAVGDRRAAGPPRAARRPDFRRKDGTELQLEYSSRVLDDGRVHTTLRDVSQRRRNEERLRSSSSSCTRSSRRSRRSPPCSSIPTR